MKNKKENETRFSKPTDMTFETFKDWFRSLSAGLGASGPEPDEERLREVWKKYKEGVEEYNKEK